jgi:hypothetical protein
MPTLQGYEQMLKGKKCSKCGEGDLEGLPITHYDHVGGWQVEGFANRQWLYVTCPACNFQVSLRKVGIAGKATGLEQAGEEHRLGLRLSCFGLSLAERRALEVWLPVENWGGR